MRLTNFISAAAFGFAVIAPIPLGAGQQAAPQTGICSGKALCYEATDFAAAVTVFRVSTNNVYRQKIIDVTARFQNKTTQAVVLGYVDHSGLATDDRGNRSIPWGPNAYRGIGLVSGNSFDPKLVLRPGGWGDAQFELVQQGTPPMTGTTYVLDLTIDEINNGGGQPTLGGEFPLHFEGLINGASGTVPALAGVPCAGPGAANKASDAASAISSIGSIFGKKKTAQAAGQVAAATAGCDPTVNAAGLPASPAAASSAASTVAAVNAAANSGVDMTPQQPATHSAASITSIKGPQANHPPAANAPPTRVSSNASNVPDQSAEPWTPPTDAAAEKAAIVDPLKLPEVMKMPDVVGVRLGMTEQQALQILHGQYPRGQFQEIPTSGTIPEYPKADYGFNVLPTGEIATDVVVSLTAPPSRQVVWRVVRFTRRIHANHANVLATLREKYGKETLAGVGNGTITTDDRLIGQLLWLFDEHGGRASMPPPQTFGSSTMVGIPCSGGSLSDIGPRITMEEPKSQDWCNSIVAILVTIDPSEIVENTFTNMVDMKLATRTANAYLAWKRDADARARAAEIAKSKQNKPVF